MKKLEICIRGICWMLWMMLFLGIAAWVGQEQWGDVSARLAAALSALFWAYFGVPVIEFSGAPKAITKALIEDE